jgi:hypothetical protein
MIGQYSISQRTKGKMPPPLHRKDAAALSLAFSSAENPMEAGFLPEPAGADAPLPQELSTAIFPQDEGTPQQAVYVADTAFDSADGDDNWASSEE